MAMMNPDVCDLGDVSESEWKNPSLEEVNGHVICLAAEEPLSKISVIVKPTLPWVTRS
jgi:hypothetical protein